MKAQLWTDRGAYEDLTYMPVFRASGIFYAVANKTITTRIAFLHYWREKNGVADLALLLTLRDTQGQKVARRYMKLTGNTYDFDIRSFVEPSQDFSGSIELEIFATEDLKFQFPGFTVFYETAHGTSYVHTNQRVYNSAEDRGRSASLNAWQGGFDIDTARYDPFIFLVNGPNDIADCKAALVVTNAQAEEMRCEVKLGDIPAYGTRDLRLRSIDGVVSFLGNDPGTCKIDLPLQDIHLRLAVGNALPDQSWLSVTHSYFDAVDHRDYYDSSTLPPDVHPAFVPLCLIDGVDVDLALYPILARCTLSLQLQCFDQGGRQRALLDLGSYSSPRDGLRHLDIRKLLAQHKVAATQGLYVLQITAPNGQIPTRITYGLNYRIGSNLGTNISSSAYMAKSWGARGRAWRWGPVAVLEEGRNLISVIGFRKEKDAGGNVEFSITLHDSNGPITTITHTMPANGATVIHAEEVLQAAGYLAKPGDILWYVLKSTSSSLDATQICQSAQGLVGGDHCF
ncbi:MAG: hypothetical protein KG075_16725 [Alphaproteobacteria bacterium]|nr:hypothetical protein [Alphaproteobacteria bacterium]